MINVFESALRKLDRKGIRRWGDDWLSRIERRKETLVTAYAALDVADRDPIAYSSLSAQATYVFSYAATRAAYTKVFLSRHRASLGGPLFTRPDVSIVSFGGGPASELVGLLHYLDDPRNGENVTDINYVIYDKDGDWEEVAADVLAGVATDINVTLTYQEVDVSNRRLMGAIDLSDIDMVMMSYLMSELCKLSRRDRISENFRNCLSTLSVGAKILFIDNLHSLFIDYFRSCKLVRGLVEKSDSGDRVEFDLPTMTGTFEKFEGKLGTPRTDLKSVSKLIVRTLK